MRVSHPAVRLTGRLVLSAVMTGFEPARTDRQSIMLPGYITSPSMQKCAEQELNLQSSKASGLQPLGPTNAQPTHVVQVARVRVELTDDHEGLSFAALPVCVPCHVSTPDRLLVREQPSPLGHRTMLQAEAVRLELTSGCCRHLFSRQAPHPAG